MTLTATDIPANSTVGLVVGATGKLSARMISATGRTNAFMEILQYLVANAIRKGRPSMNSTARPTDKQITQAVEAMGILR